MNQSLHRVFHTLLSIIGNLPILYLCFKVYDIDLLADFSKGILLFQYLFLVNEWGFNLYALQNINSKKIINEKIINEIIFAKILLGFANLIFISFVFLLDVIVFNNPYMPFFLIFITFLSALNPLWFFQAIGRIELLNLPLLLLKLSQILLLYLLIESWNVGLFFILQGFIFFSLFLYNLYKLKKFYKYKLEINYPNFLLGISGINKMKAHFFSNLHNHLNLTLWGIVLIVISSPIQIIIFNLVDTIYRGMNAIFQSIIEPIFRDININLKVLIYFFLFPTIIFIPIYYFMPFLTHTIFPKYSNELIEVFRLLSILLAILFASKIFTYFSLGKENIAKMNKLNIQFLFFEIFLVVTWYLLMEINVKEIILLLLFLNLIKISFLVLLKLFPKNAKSAQDN
jgi:hypothetical protein